MDDTTFDQDIEDAWAEDGDMETGEDQTEDMTDTEAQEQAAEETPEQNPADGQQPPAQPRQQAADQRPDTYLLRNRDETRTVGRDEVIAMAQKGWDYDNVRLERDQLREYRQQAGPAMDLVSTYAQRAGMTVEKYIDYCRQQEIMATGVDEVNARAQVQNEKWQAQQEAQTRAMQAEQAAQQRAAEAAQRQAEARRADLNEFVRTYPGVNPADIGEDVWKDVAAGSSLTNAYMRAENRRLTAELAAIKQNSTNKERAPGSLAGNAGQSQSDIDRWWAEDD